jgi:3-oxoacyl-[acyl-carrier-protein] synthase-3
MHDDVGISALSVVFPAERRNNAFFEARAPHVVDQAKAHTLSSIFAPSETTEKSLIFDEEMMPYLHDPFRGTKERRALAVGETALGLERQALLELLRAADRTPGDIDLLICVSFLPEHPGLGNAAFLANELGMAASVLNLESTCVGAMMALQTAHALVNGGVYRNAAVVVSCTYSRNLDLDDSLAWFLGDGVGAFLVEPRRGCATVLASHTVSTAETCGAFVWEYEQDAPEPRLVVRPGKNNPSKSLRDTAGPNLLRCTEGVLKKAGMHLDDVKFLVVNTPVAWYHRFAARALGIDLERTLSTFEQFGNIGPALTTTNLFYAAHGRHIAAGDVVLLYGFGTVSNASAMLIRWGDVALGPAPIGSGRVGLVARSS